MTPEIKQRIDQIQNGEIPEGYKKTKTGVIPASWSYEKLGPYLVQHHEVSSYNNQYPVLTSSRKGIFFQKQYYEKEVASEDNTGYNVVPRGYFTYRHMSDDEIFVFNINTICDKGIVSTLYPVFTVDCRINPCFLKEILNNGSDFKRYARMQKQGGSRTYMYFNKLTKLSIPIPPLSEQERIIGILSAQNKVIECYEKNIEQLKQMKKYYLQNMFPQRGETVPKIRFKGFSGSWEQRKLGNVFQEYSEKNHTELSPLTIIQGCGTILRDSSERTLHYDRTSLSEYKLVKKDDFILHLRSFEGGLEKANSDGIVSPAYHIFHGNKTDSSFYYPFFRSRYFIDALLKPHVYGIRDGKSINIKGIKTILIPVPTIDEQKAIGEFFNTIEKQISLYQRKLEEEKKKKKALHQLLLTGIVRVKL